jgi:uncharacterized membrane protein YhaH (DUF805 family)
MDFIGSLGFLITATLIIAAIIVLTSSVNIKGKGQLIGFFVLMLVSYTGSFSYVLILQTGALGYDTYRHIMTFTGMVFTLCRLSGWVLLLLFVIGLRSLQKTGEARTDEQFADEEMTISRALFSFQGRMCRSDYWLKGFLPMLPFGIMNNILAYGIHEDWSRAIVIVLAIASIWPTMALIIKRLHDRNHSGWFACIMLIPIVGPIWLIVEVWFLKGTNGPNRFGNDPLQLIQSIPAAS